MTCLSKTSDHYITTFDFQLLPALSHTLSSLHTSCPLAASFPPQPKTMWPQNSMILATFSVVLNLQVPKHLSTPNTIVP